MQNAPADASWRDSARSARFFIFDASAMFPIVFFLLYIRFWTFVLAVSVIVFLTAIARYGFTITIFARWLRATIAGPRRIAIPWWL